MKLSFMLPTKIIMENNCVLNHKEVFTELGHRAMIVTGRNSAKSCGALTDVTHVLDSLSISYIIYDKIENNPSVETVEDAGKIAVEEKVDFVIGIGGGSPIDASKAIAVMAANPHYSSRDLFGNTFDKALPILCIPTTAGTGSEVTPYSVLLRKDMETKVSFGNRNTYPKVAMVDAKYTCSLNKDITINTAVDAFTHCLEGYISLRSTKISDALALSGIEAFGKCLQHLISFQLTQDDRDNLMYASLIGGMVIAQTGVTIAHAMGYCYTYFHNISHGRANGLLMREYLIYNNETCHNKIDKALSLLGYHDISEFCDVLDLLLGKAPALSEEEIDKYTELTMLQKGSIANTPNPLDKETVNSLWKKVSGI